MSTAVVTKEFIWKFIDQVTEGVKQARAAMNQAENSAKQAGLEVRNSGTNWKKAGDDAEQAAQKTTEAVNKSKSDIESMSSKVKESISSIRGSLNLYEDKLNGIPKEKVTNFEAKVKDTKLDAFSRKIHDVPNEKNTTLSIKDHFSNGIRNAQNQAEQTKKSFLGLKTIMAGTFVGGTILGGISAIGNGLKEAAGAGMEFDTEQQKMLATWHTLTGSAHQAQGMVDTINDLSIKTGQATDTINELEQGFYHLHSSKSEADDMTKAMLNMGDAVGLSGQQLTQVEQDMVHGLATGKVTQGELNQIGMYFPMIDERMAKHFNTTVAGMRKMASAGKITGKDLEEVFEQMGNSGKYKNAVDNMMQTTWGSMRTIRSMVPRLVGSLEDGLFKAQNPLVGAIAKWTTDPATKKGFQDFGKSIASTMNSGASAVTTLVKAFQPLNRFIGAAVSGLASGVWTGFAQTMRAIGTSVLTVVNLFSKLVGLIPGVGKGNTALKATHDAFKAIGAVIGSLIAVMTTYKTVELAALAVDKTYHGILLAKRVALALFTTTAKTATTATKDMTIAQKALNLAEEMNPIGIIVIALTALVGGLILAYKNIKPFRDAVNRLGESIKRVFTGKSSWDKAIVNQFKALNKAFDRDGKAFKKKVSQWGKSLWDGMTGNAKWEKDLQKRFKQAQKDYQNNANQTRKIQQRAQAQREKDWDNYWRNVSKKSQRAWEDIKKHASNGMSNVGKTIGSWMKTISKNWMNGWETIGNFFRNIWNTIRSFGSGGMRELSSAISNGMRAISSAWTSGWNAMLGFFRGIWNGIKQAAADGMNGVINVINAAIGGINKVWSFFTGHGTGLSNIGHVHFAQGGTVHRHLSVINDGDGPDWKELVQTPDGNLFMSQERNWTGFLPEGTRVYSGPETRQIMNAVGVSHYASGGIVGDVEEGIDWAKGSLDNLGSWLGDKFSALEDFLADPLKATKGLLEKVTNGLYNNLGHYADLAHGAMDKLTQPIADWFKKGLEKLEAQFESGGASPDLIRAAAAKMHVSISGADISHIMNVIQHESGGRANAVNNWDSNAAKGTPSKGILQFIEPTFMSYAMPGHTNILSPFDQLLAMFNDTTWRSDLTLGGWGPTGGRRYALGGEVFGLTNAIIGDNPQHHEIVLNPYAPSADHLLDRAFETTASAQPGSGNASQGNSKLDRMIGLLEMLLDSVDSIDPNTYLDGEMITKNANKRNAKVYARREI